MDWGSCILCQKHLIALGSTPLITGTKQFVDMLNSKTTLKNIKEKKFPFL